MNKFLEKILELGAELELACSNEESIKIKAEATEILNKAFNVQIVKFSTEQPIRGMSKFNASYNVQIGDIRLGGNLTGFLSEVLDRTKAENYIKGLILENLQK